MTQTDAPDITVSIVSYNTCDLLRDCLRSLAARQAEGEATLEIVVADNGSSDGSPEMVRAEFPAVRLIETGGNLGYGRANNLALQDARGRFFLVFNSDAEPEPGALALLRDFLDNHPQVGIVGGQLVWPDGRPQTSWGDDPTLLGVLREQTYWDALRGRLPRRPRPQRSAGPRPPGLPHDVEQLCGACLLVHREAWQEVGGFDPAYFMYNEDVDLNVRVRRSGRRVVFLPQARIRHHLGSSSARDWRTRARMVAAYNQSRYYYFSRFEGANAGRRLKAFCLLGAGLRLGAWGLFSLARPGVRDQVRLFRDVLRRTRRMRPEGEGYNAAKDIKAPFVPLEDVLAQRQNAGETADALAPPQFMTVTDGKKLRNTYLAAILSDDELGTWALDAATLNFLEREIQAQPPQAVLEFGAGLSTICFARFMHDLGHRNHPVVFSIEQNEWQVERSRERLAQIGLDQLVTVLHAPLEIQTIGGRQTECYALPPDRISHFLGGARPDFVVIDGPAGDDSVRFGTLPLVQNFLLANSRFFLDDALRDDEIEVARRWSEMPGIEIEGVYTVGKGLLGGTVSAVSDQAPEPQGGAA